MRTVERLFRRKREQCEGEKNFERPSYRKLSAEKVKDCSNLTAQGEKFVELSHKSPLAVYTKIVLAIRSFNYKWEAVKLVFSLSASDKRGYTHIGLRAEHSQRIIA